MKQTLRIFSLVTLFAFSTNALAAELHGVRMPDSVVVEGKTLKLNGIGVRTKTFLGIKVYVTGLWLEALTSNPEQLIAKDAVRRLQLQMTHSAPKKRWREEIMDGLTRNSKAQLPALQDRLDRFFDGVPDLAEGQVLSLTYLPGKGTLVRAGSAPEFTLPGKDLADALFSAWLGKDPLDADLKQRLLGK